MKKIFLLSLVFAGFVGDMTAVAAPARRATRATSGAAATTATAGKTTAARAAVGARGVRAATTTAAKPVVAARAATATTAAKPTVAARAATTQKVVNSGTKVAAAAKNIVVSEDCQAKYEGCMDSFCMLDNDTGGRCLCSDKNSEYDAILAEIEKLDQQSYQMATFGVEKLEMGADADAAIAMANAAADSVVKKTESGDAKKTARKALDLSLWNTAAEFEDDMDDVFGQSSSSPIDGKEGDALHRAAASICAEQIPECKSEMNMLQMMYGQRVKSDCTAYENSLKQQKNSSQQKLYAAEKALREAALEQHRSANKYDLGQCTVEFKKCMQTTAGCGNDFAGCASMVALDTTSTRKSSKNADKLYSIKGAVTTIDISMSTYDALMAKKPLCESVTKSCVNVAGQVWDTFLREIAPQIKSAELIAEDKARQDCIGNISSCFQKACKDNIDPNDPDGSYDMCLSRPGTMLSVCKVPLNNCGIDASSESAAAANPIWDFVTARLAAMRVDSCTTEVKECLQSDDRCGEDYSKCIGLDTDTIIRMCPYDKLVGCQKVYGEDNIRGDAVYDELASMVQGIMLNMDNNFLTQCQNAANEAMIKVCGDAENCNSLAVDDGIGSRSLDYKICEYTSKENSLDIDYGKCRTDISQIQDTELGRVLDSSTADLGPVTPFSGVIDGVIYWEAVEIDEDGRLSTVDNYLSKIDATNMSSRQKDMVSSELAVLQKTIDNAINTIESDPTVQFCMTGREVQGMKTNAGASKNIGRRVKKTVDENGNEVVENADAARFPELTKQMRMIIATAALQAAKTNYNKKYDELNEKMLQDYAKIGERMAEIQGENAKDVHRELGRQACVEFANMSALPKSPTPPKNAFGAIFSGILIVGSVVAAPFTGGLTLAGAVAGVATGIGAAASNKGGNGADSAAQRQLVGSKSVNQWNYKETITSTFNWDTMQCERCIRSQSCSSTKRPLFGSPYCKSWGGENNSCSTTQF